MALFFRGRDFWYTLYSKLLISKYIWRTLPPPQLYPEEEHQSVAGETTYPAGRNLYPGEVDQSGTGESATYPSRNLYLAEEVDQNGAGESATYPGRQLYPREVDQSSAGGDLYAPGNQVANYCTGQGCQEVGCIYRELEGNQPVGGAVSTTNSSIQPAGQQVNTAGIQEELFDLPKRNESVDFYDEQQLSATEEELQAERSVDASTQTVDVYSSTMDSPTCSAVML